jgi:hypothetical protein
MDTRQGTTIKKATSDSKAARFMTSMSKAESDALQVPTITHYHWKWSPAECSKLRCQPFVAYATKG